MSKPELFPPKGYFRADEAYRRWMEIRFDHRQLKYEEQDQSREQFISWLEHHRLIVNIYTEDGTAHDVPDSAWDRKFFPDLLVLHKTIPMINGSPFDRYAGAILIVLRSEVERSATSDLKDELFEELKYGRMELQRARMVAAKAGIASLEGNPEKSLYDPMVEPYWSLPMAVSWIASRTSDEVREHWNKYLENCFYFHHTPWRIGPGGEIHKGWLCENRGLASINLFFGTDKFVKAKAALFLSLKQGDIAATGLTEQGTGRKLIPNHEWQDLTCPTINGKDVFRPSPGVAGYVEVTVARDAVVARWPAPIAIWDFALLKRNYDTDLAARLVIEIYAAFWKGELGIPELSLVQSKIFGSGADVFEGLPREYLAQAALGGKRFGELGPDRAFVELAQWNYSDYGKVDEGYRYYFIPETGIKSMESQGRGLCGSPDMLETWFAKVNPSDVTDYDPVREFQREISAPKKAIRINRSREVARNSIGALWNGRRPPGLTVPQIVTSIEDWCKTQNPKLTAPSQRTIEKVLSDLSQ